jgi:hypothetical protein
VAQYAIGIIKASRLSRSGANVAKKTRRYRVAEESDGLKAPVDGFVLVS